MKLLYVNETYVDAKRKLYYYERRWYNGVEQLSSGREKRYKQIILRTVSDWQMIYATLLKLKREIEA